MTDTPAVSPTASPAAYNPGGYPVQVEVTTPETLERWRVLQIILAIPSMIVLYVLFLAAEVVSFIAWFAILFTGRYPEGMWDFSVGVHRWRWRLSTYIFFLHPKYPPWQLDSGETDPATEPALYAVARPGERNRLTCALRFIWAIPAYAFAFVIGIAVEVCVFLAWFAVLFTGKWPEGLRDFVVKGLRVSERSFAYAFLLVDEYPPFSLD